MTSTNYTPYILIDSTDTRLKYDNWQGGAGGAGWWKPENVTGTLGGSNLRSQNGTVKFKLEFAGKEIVVYGGSRTRNMSASWTIDGVSGTSYNMPKSTNTPSSVNRNDDPEYDVATGIPWFKSPLLNSSNHVLHLYPDSKTVTMDYAVINPGPETPLDGNTLIVDDSMLEYKGTWKRWAGERLTNDKYGQGRGLPFNSTLQGAVEAGASLRFNFTGVSVGVYGAIAGDMYGDHGFYNCSFSLDDAQPVYKTLDTRSRVLRLHEELFQRDVSQGNHSLLVELIALNLSSPSGSPILYLDYILFGPTTSIKFKLPAPTPFPSRDSGKSSTKGLSSGGIVGVLAGVVLVFLVFLTMKCGRSRQKKRFIRPTARPLSPIFATRPASEEIPTLYPRYTPPPWQSPQLPLLSPAPSAIRTPTTETDAPPPPYDFV